MTEPDLLETAEVTTQYGTLCVLNVGTGDTTVTFDPGNPAEVAKGMRMLLDMQKRGYLIAVQLPDGTYTRAIEIDPTSGSYIITLPEDTPLPEGASAVHDKSKRRRGRPSKKVKVPVEKTHAVGVARSAGG